MTNARIDMNSDIGALYVESINEIAAVHAERVMLGLQSLILIRDLVQLGA